MSDEEEFRGIQGFMGIDVQLRVKLLCQRVVPKVLNKGLFERGGKFVGSVGIPYLRFKLVALVVEDTPPYLGENVLAPAVR